MKNIPTILKAMFAVFFVLQIIVYTNLYAGKVDVTKLDRYLDKLEMNEQNLFSLSVTEKENPVYLRSVGFIDPMYHVHSNPDTRYRIGELSRTFTSVIVMQMVEEKIIQLGTPISRFFPAIPNAKHISIRDLLSHRVHIINYLPGGKFYSYIKSDYVFDALLEEDGSVFQQEFKFNDPNYLMLGIIIEQIEGRDYSEVMRTRITDRIGLNNTFSISNFPTHPNLLNEVIGKWDINSLTGSGNMMSTPGDLGKFMNALFCKELVNDKSLNILLSLNEEINPELKQVNFGNKHGFGYSGSMDGFNTQTVYFSADSICISFSTNENQHITMDELVKIVYGS